MDIKARIMLEKFMNMEKKRKNTYSEELKEEAWNFFLLSIMNSQIELEDIKSETRRLLNENEIDSDRAEQLISNIEIDLSLLKWSKQLGKYEIIEPKYQWNEKQYKIG